MLHSSNSSKTKGIRIAATLYSRVKLAVANLTLSLRVAEKFLFIKFVIVYG